MNNKHTFHINGFIDEVLLAQYLNINIKSITDDNYNALVLAAEWKEAHIEALQNKNAESAKESKAHFIALITHAFKPESN